METIHYISDFTYFSGKKVSGKYGNVVNAIREHIMYIGRKAEGVFTFNLDINEWIEKAKSEIRKRWDSRVALKFVMALPLEVNEENVESVADAVQEFIAEKLNVEKKNISIAVHLHKGISGNYNPHAHILVYPRNREGKKLRLNRKDLSEFHREWQKVLRELGYRIKIKKDTERLPHLGTRIHYDPDVQELYEKYLKVERLNKKLESVRREMNNHRREKEEEKEGKEFEVEGKSIKDFFSKFFEDKEIKDFREKQRRALALHFKRLGYSPEDRLAIVLVNHQTNDVLQRVFTVKEILEDKVLRFLSAKNSQGYSVYASVNVLRENATRRRKDDFKFTQKRIYLDLDSKTVNAKKLIGKLYQYIQLKGLPMPTHIVKSSKGNYQVYWVLENEVRYDLLEKVMEQMNTELGLDHTQDVSRVFRLPYFRNKKIGKDDLVVNIKSLNVYLGDEVIGEIKATGEPVSDKTFFDLLREPSLEPKPLVVNHKPNIDKEMEEFWLKVIRKQREREKREKEEELRRKVENYIRQGYSEKVAEYRLFFDFDDIDPELKSIIDIAFERNKNKSPSEVDLAFLGLLYSRYNGKPPENLREEAESLIILGARWRGKADPWDYLWRTVEEVEEYWEKRNKPKSDNDNLPPLTPPRLIGRRKDNDNDKGIGFFP